MRRRSSLLFLLVGFLIVLAACGGGSMSTGHGSTTYTVSAAVSGLNNGASVVLGDSLGDALTFTGNTTQAFATAYASGASYSVSITTQPTGETCTLGSNSSGTISANVTVQVTCTTVVVANYTLSAAVTGLVSGAQLVLQDNQNDQLTFTSNTTQNFTNTYSSGSSYSVSIVSQPAGEVCTLSNGSGTITSNLTVNATCVPNQYPISVTVSGLASGTSVVLSDSNGDSLTFSSNTTKNFATTYASGASYSVSVTTQPTGGTCTLSNASGTVGSSTVAVTATCAVTTYTISATVTGLNPGATVVLQDDKNDTLNFSSNSTQPFASSYFSGATYSVIVATQPTGETCTLSSNSSGTITSNITVTATCVATQYTISAAVTGLLAGGTLVLQDNGTSNLTFTSNITQSFSTLINSGSAYNVTVLTQPTGQTCTLGSNSSGTATSNVTVAVTCTLNNYTISVAVTGLGSGQTLVVQDNGANNLTFASNSTQSFPQQQYNTAYAVTILTQPTGQSCTLGSSSSGTLTQNITVTATCTNNTYTISVSVSGLTGTLVVQDSPTDQLTFTSNTTKAFNTQYSSGNSYSVTITTQPSGETCTLSNNATGTIGSSNVTVSATCTANQTYTISVAVSGLTSGTLVVQDDQSDQLSFTKNNTQTFATSYASGASYTVSVTTQPSGETCTLGSNATGTITANITVNATCAANGTFTIGGTLYELGAGSVVLQDNGGDNLTLTANGSFTFPTALASGASYKVTVKTQPTGPPQVCTVTNGSGTANGDVTNVQVACIAEWTWINGNKAAGQKGVYGTKRVASSTNSPGARRGSATWIDASGNLWMFGGIGYNDSADEAYLNDLWKYSPSTNEWTWWSGSNQYDTYGVYSGTSGTLIPGSRISPVSWVDSSGVLWMFGGYGYDGDPNQTAPPGPLNDLWTFNTTSNVWTFVGGSTTTGASGVYTGANAFPGARYAATGAVDSSGNFWMFGGNGIDSTGAEGDLNDLWEYSNGTWSFVNGAEIVNQKGVYSTTAKSTNVPGSRLGASAWIDSAGDVWLFGGVGYDSNGDAGPLNDVWQYSQGEWVWVGGGNTINQPATYGTQGIPATGNIPGAREYATIWNTPSGNVWLFGGIEDTGGVFNDLWEYSGGQWTYISGSQLTNQLGVYGTEGTAAITNLPGGRNVSMGWTDATGNLWLMGGFGWGNGTAAQTGNPPFDGLNDLWEFQP